MYFFFFSSRRRHTRLQGDWSSDVCSSDLPRDQRGIRGVPVAAQLGEQRQGYDARQHENEDGKNLQVAREDRDRKSTRLNSSHLVISYAVFCLKKKKKRERKTTRDRWRTQV